MRNYCRALHDVLDDFTFVVDEIGDEHRFDARLSELLRQEAAVPNCDVYAVPPPHAVATTRAALLALNVGTQHISVAGLQSI